MLCSHVLCVGFLQLFGKDGYRQLKEEFLRDARQLNEEREDENDEDDVPFIKLVYQRSCKDKTKLVVLPLLYFLFMCLAGVVAFYSISGLIVSYRHKVRSVEYVTVDAFRTIGIAMFPETFASFENCEFLYHDDLSPGRDNWSTIVPPDQLCKYRNITFFSNLIKEDRDAIVFDGPTLVNLKQSLAIHFTIDTTTRNFSGMEYLLMGNWHAVKDLSYDEQSQYLQSVEQSKPLNTVPAGFRTWVKMSYVVRKEDGGNISDFTVTPDFSTYNDWRNISDRTDNVIYAVFEWKSNSYEYVHEIVSTTIWSTLGSLAGIFITLVKVGEYCQRWVQRLRREKRKKLQKLKELEEEQERLREEYERKRAEKRMSRKELDCY